MHIPQTHIYWYMLYKMLLIFRAFQVTSFSERHLNIEQHINMQQLDEKKKMDLRLLISGRKNDYKYKN